MTWNWQQPDWPRFAYETAPLDAFERRFLLRAGEFLGVLRHVGEGDRDDLRIELISEEALGTAAIEGEFLNRASIQASLRRQLGLGGGPASLPAAENGLAEMLVSVYRTFSQPLTHDALFAWHRMLMADGRHIRSAGAYRSHSDPMQIVSGPEGRRRIHFEAPPSARVSAEMDAFLAWFNDTGPDGERPLPALTRAAIAHLYFESIHPFEDGNGRIGRAVSEKALAQGIGAPSLILLAQLLERQRKRYYDMLEASSQQNKIDPWLAYFAATVLDAQSQTMARVAFTLSKAKFYGRFRGQFNARQEKVIARLFREGPAGFKGGLSAENYLAITGASRATATRDLQDLVAKGALSRSGTLRHTRYALILISPLKPHTKTPPDDEPGGLKEW